MEDVHADAESMVLFAEQEHLEGEALRHAASSGGRGGAALQRAPPPTAKAALRGVAAAALCTALRDLWAAHSLHFFATTRSALSQLREERSHANRCRTAALVPQLMADAKASFVNGGAQTAASTWHSAVLLQLLVLEGGGGGRDSPALTLLADLMRTRMRARPHFEV